jgi:hypothetical protein
MDLTLRNGRAGPVLSLPVTAVLSRPDLVEIIPNVSFYYCYSICYENYLLHGSIIS